MKLEEQKAVIVGGGSGMGRATSLEFAREGADIAVLDLSLENAEKTADEVSRLGREAIALEVDVTDFKAVHDCINQVYDKFKRIDILVNAAGYGRLGDLSQMTEETWDRSIAVHLKGPFNAMHAVINGMISQRYGRIINITSISALRGTRSHCHYAAAKTGLVGLTKSVAREVATVGITVNAIAPGSTNTPWQNALTKEQREADLRSLPMGRRMEPEEIAALCLYLASKEAAYITGSHINITGGVYM